MISVIDSLCAPSNDPYDKFEFNHVIIAQNWSCIGDAEGAIVPSTITWNYTEHAKLCGRSSYIPKSECERVCLECDMIYEI